MEKGSSLSQLLSHILTKTCQKLRFLQFCMFPIVGPFSKFSGMLGKSSHVSDQWANSMLKNLKLLLLCFLHYSSIPQHELRLKPYTIYTVVDVYW